MKLVITVLVLVFCVGVAVDWRSTKSLRPVARVIFAVLSGFSSVALVVGAMLLIGVATNMVLN